MRTMSLPALLANALLLLVFSTHARAQVTDLGQIDFPNSGAPEAQEAFLTGALLLHSFEYEDAAESFREAQAIDPDFVLAYWGEALTYSHTLWRQEDQEKALEVLGRLGTTPAERAKRAMTERERGLLRAVERLWGDGDRKTRKVAYSDELARLHAQFPDDLEIASFYSISILGKAMGERDHRLALQAAAIAEEVFQKNPRHPGALHYAIHSYDDPIHAPLGLRMARVYAKVAPAAAHALHMPSHIYVALGLWEDSASSNEDSSAAADARRARKQLSIEARGYHSLYWLAYTYLQLGRFQEARKLLADMIRDEKESGTKSTRSSLATMRNAYLVGTGQWDDPVAEIEMDPAELRPSTVANNYFVSGAAAAYRGKMDEAEKILDSLQALQKKLGDPDLISTPALAEVASCCNPAPLVGPYGPRGRKEVAIITRELEGIVHLKSNRIDEALLALKEATRIEDTLSFDFGPPIIIKPAHELLGEVLLEIDRPEEAAAEFQAALFRAPRKTRALLGLARAATRTKQIEIAKDSWNRLALILHRADDEVPYLKEVRASSSGTPGSSTVQGN